MAKMKHPWMQGLRGGLVGGVGSLAIACTAPSPHADPSSVIDKIGFDLNQLDENGLVGPVDGKRALDYEFCIPRQNTTAANEVRAIDPTVQFYPDSPGRIGCTSEQILVIGNTHQDNAQTVLMELANLEYIERIEPVVWE